MSDSTEQIVRLAEEWGANTDKLFGSSLKEQQQAAVSSGIHRWAKQSANQIGVLTNGCRKAVTPGDQFLISISSEVAAALEVEPFEQIWIDTRPVAPRIFVDYEQWSLIVTESALNILNRNDLRAILGHELHHFRQPVDHTMMEKFTATVSGCITRWLAQGGFPMGQQLKDQFDSYLEQRAEIAKEREFEADLVGAHMTSPDVMAVALIKILLDDDLSDYHHLTIMRLAEWW